MAQYKESALTGTIYRRARHITIQNPLGALPSVQYVEEDVMLTPEGVRKFYSDTDPVGGGVTMDAVIALRDVSTGELTGATVPALFVYQALYSDYMTRALARDALLNQSMNANTAAVIVTAPETQVE